jgi:hypothetical protein
MKAGDYFAVPLRRALYGAALVIDHEVGYRFLVCDGFWETRPAAADVRGVSWMKLPGRTPPAFEDEIFKGWFEGDVPADFVVITTVALTDAETKLATSEGTTVFLNARSFARSLSDEWRKLYDREALLEERARRSEQHLRQRSARRAELTLRIMLEERFFETWGERWTRESLEHVRGLFLDATRRLVDRQASGTARKRAAVLTKLTEALNRFDNHTGLIESVERDQIVERIEELASLVGLDNDDEKLTGGRTW